MLKISKLADYATLIVNDLAEQPESLLSAQEIARRTQVPLPTVSKVLKLLAEKALVTGERGMHGGYRLARSAEAISLMEVISAIDGAPALTECSSQQVSHCYQQQGCAVKHNWRLIHGLMMQVLRQITVAEMRQSLLTHPVLAKFSQEMNNHGH